jgi:hypothetical protein
MKKTVCLGLSLIFCASNAYSQITSPQRPQIELLGSTNPYSQETIDLTASYCATSPTWRQVVGPSDANILTSGTQVTAEINQAGYYEFEHSCCTIDRKGSLLNSPSLVGFGQYTTGGSQSSGYTVVTNVNDDGPGSLRQALAQGGPVWIVFDPSINGKTIYLQSELNISNSDITIDGRGASVTLSPTRDGMHLAAFRGGNTIIHGIKLDGRGHDATALMLREGRNYWIDHVTITNFSGDDAISIGQGNKVNTSASEITISNYRAHNTSKGLKAGGNGTYPNFPVNRVTVHTSELAAEERNPRTQYGSIFHVFNSYVHSFIYAGMDSGRNAQIISENNVFSALSAKNNNNAQMGRFATAKVYPLEGPNGPIGHVYSTGDLFIDSANSSGSINPSSPSPFNIPYSYNLQDANAVVGLVQKNAGVENLDNTMQNCQIQTFSHTSQ